MWVESDLVGDDDLSRHFWEKYLTTPGVRPIRPRL